MSYTKQQQRPVVPTPATASEELHAELVTKYTTHFKAIISLDMLLANRKSVFGLVINSHHNNLTLEQALGSVNATIATGQVLDAIIAEYQEVK